MKRTTRRQSGVSMLELLITTSIFISLAATAAPGCAALLLHFRSISTQQSLLTLIGQARSEALHLNRPTTICPLAANNICSTDWNEPLTLFVDDNRNAQFENGEILLRVWDELEGPVFLNWLRGRSFLRFLPNGSTTATTGSLRYCVLGYENENFRIVIARTGRSRADRLDPRCDAP